MSQPFAKLFDIDFDVSQNLSHQARADVFALVDRNCRAAAVWMLELPMTSFGLPQKQEAHFSKARMSSRDLMCGKSAWLTPSPRHDARQ